MRYLVIFLILLTCACDQAKKGKVLSEYDTPELSEQALASALKDACTLSREKSVPVLIEFSAPWCGDCNKLHQMKQDEVLAKELEAWPMVVVNVGQFDQHESLLKSFDINAIATWFVVNPSDCDASVESWPRKANRTLEPMSGAKVTSAELATWLKDARL